MHVPALIFDLAIILAVAGFMSVLFHKLKQPVVLGYILAGLIVGPHTPPFQLVKDIPTIHTWAELGVIFLMFSLGLEFSFRKLLSVGITATVTAALEVIFFCFVGYGLGQWFGWSVMDSIFLGAMLSISSTTIIIKALEELKLKSRRFSSLIFGVLIVEDLFAILLLVGLTTIASSGSFSPVALGFAGVNLVVVVGGWFITGSFIVPRIMSLISKGGNSELITLVSVGLCLCLVVLAAHFNYSPALGAFIMGSILAETPVIHTIEKQMKPLRDLFGAVFFVSIGMLIDPSKIWEYKGVILILCIVTIVGKIWITSFGALVSGQNLKNSLQVGFGLAQIGEFSFIIAGLGVALKATSDKLYPIGVAVSLVTTFTTPYLIKYSGSFADAVEAKLPFSIKDLLNRYVAWSEHKKGHNPDVQELLGLIFRWFANGIVMTLIFNIVFKYVGPFLKVSTIVTLLIAIFASVPFIYGMVFTSRKHYIRIRKERSMLKAIIVLLLPILTAAWIVIITSKYFPPKYVLAITSVFLLIVYVALFKKLESYYRWLEKSFLASFENHEAAIPEKEFAALAPWDSHLVEIIVHPNAAAVNSTLIQANLRQRFGINVVAIQRGIQTIVAPKPGDVLLPGDNLVILGTDKQIDSARPELESPKISAEFTKQTSDYRLRHLKVKIDSPLSGKTIRSSGIREKYHAMVVGIERSGKRNINPDTDLDIRPDDILWIVGEQGMLDDLMKEL